MFKTLFAVMLLLFLSPSLIRRDHLGKSYFIVWNVGQGQWSTLVEDTTCHHYDMGGEKNPLRSVARLCRDKENFISLSHWDSDHIGFAARARSLLPQACLEIPPLGKSSPHKMKILSIYPACAAGGTSPSHELTHFTDADLAKKTNELSHVILVKGKILVPGDSTAKQEKTWSHVVSLAKVKLLLLGHHGSRTSTSEELLSELPHLRVAISSARFARYGHPHQEVARRLKRHHVPLLKTEDWGHLWFEQN